MDPRHQPITPSKALSSLNLGSSTPKRRRNFICDGSSPPSVFDNGSPTEAYSVDDSPTPQNRPSAFMRGLNPVTDDSFTIARPNKRRKSANQGAVVRSFYAVPNEIWDKIFDYIVAVDPQEDRLLLPVDAYDNPETKELFSSLRLVTPRWSTILAPRIFKRISGLLGRAEDPLKPVFKASVSQWASDVHDVSFGIVGAWHEGDMYDAYITNVSTGAVSVLLSRFENMKTLRLQSPTVVAPFCAEDQIPAASLAKLTGSIIHAMRYVSLPKLKCLYISLPVTAEFGRFFDVESYTDNFTTILSHIEEMHLIINDDSGIEAFRKPATPRSNIKARYPLQPFAEYLTQFIGCAENVKILTVETRAPLNLTGLEASKMTKLECLKLERVELEWETLRDIFYESRATLRRLELNEIKLLTGTWQDVFELENTSLIDLEFIALRGNSYALTSANVRFNFQLQSWSPLHTLVTTDWRALRNLETRVVMNRNEAGLFVDLDDPLRNWHFLH
ncbi:unnamed protein product [Penicillium salamii]|uniref:Uncharacterized protein n=1 Tax=Penicillium salamii TaxID=1612424 RepID=A0A9W4IYN9_9EURO|nr:unnamed protein product [Penicillium salamii]